MGCLSPRGPGTLRRWAWWELVGLRATGWRGPRRPLCPELPGEANGCSWHIFPVLSISTSGFEVSTSQEYRSTSNTAPSQSSLAKPQSSEPRKKIGHRGLSRGSKATQAAEYLNPPSGQRCNSSKAEAPQGPKPKPRKTEAPQSPRSSTTEVTRVKKPSKTRAALSPGQRLRRSRAVGAHSLKPKAHGNSQKQTKRSSRTHLFQDSSGSLTSTNESQDRPPEPSKDDPSSWSESPATSSSRSGNLLEQNLQLSKSKVSQESEDSPQLSKSKMSQESEDSPQLSKSMMSQESEDTPTP
ncbi:tetratricopeptide repeat protein 16-like [Acomys russatus]|uniref:tetratricopeptide repeat protein 16-like n=1 Tax=Acomys russatus TaxID=60746 RepID=UPI0021E2289C|nr:tetratricopeptide repeat protein 16-like [Acomys russatus]